MSTALDTPLLRRYTRARRHPWWANAWVPVLSLVGFLVVAIATTGDVPCTATAPCSPDFLEYLGAGALLAGSALTRVSGRAALLATVVGVPLSTTTQDGAWALTALAGHVLVLALVVRGRRRALPSTATTTRSPVPAPPAAERPFLVGAVVATVLALALTGTYVALLVPEQARERSAPVVRAVVTAHVDEYVLVLALPGPGPSTAQVEVLDAAEHPVGSDVAVRRFEDGSLRTVAEPYDPWGAAMLAGMATAVATALLGARSRRVARRRHLAEDLVPLVAARARVLPGVAFVHTVDAGPRDEPVLVVPLVVPDDEEAFDEEAFDEEAFGEEAFGEEAFDEDDEDDEVELPEVVDVLLAGVPVPGEWCAVAVDGAWLTPAGPCVTGTGGPPLVLEDDPLDADGLPVLAVPLADLAPQDVVPRDGVVDREHEHRQPLLVGVVSVLPALALAVAGPEWVQALVDGPTARTAVAGVLGLVALELMWRFQLRPRLSWDHDGLVVVGSRGPARRYAWRALVLAEPVDRLGLQLVLLHDPADPEGSDVAVHVAQVPGPRVPAVLRLGRRTAPQLRAALLQARAVGDPGLRGCELSPAPARPWEWWSLWLLVLCVAWVAAG